MTEPIHFKYVILQNQPDEIKNWHVDLLVKYLEVFSKYLRQFHNVAVGPHSVERIVRPIPQNKQEFVQLQIDLYEIYKQQSRWVGFPCTYSFLQKVEPFSGDSTTNYFACKFYPSQGIDDQVDFHKTRGTETDRWHIAQYYGFAFLAHEIMHILYGQMGLPDTQDGGPLSGTAYLIYDPDSVKNPDGSWRKLILAQAPFLFTPTNIIVESSRWDFAVQRTLMGQCPPDLPPITYKGGKCL